jgi:hypothetical protein
MISFKIVILFILLIILIISIAYGLLLIYNYGIKSGGMPKSILKTDIVPSDTETTHEIIQNSQNTQQQITGGYNDQIANLPDQIYNLMLEYVDEIGTSEYIEDYLMQLHDIKSLKIDDEVANMRFGSQQIEYKTLFQLIKNLTQQYEYDNKYDFIFSNGIKYKYFIPKEIHGALCKLRGKHQLFDKYVIRMNLEQLVYPVVISKDKIEKIAAKLMGLSRNYIKIKKSQIKKLLEDVKKGGAAKAKKKKPEKKDNKTTKKYNTYDIDKSVIEPDIIGFNAVLSQIAEMLKAATITPITHSSTPEEQLNKIDLIQLRWQNPEAVRRFIQRIKPDIKYIEELDYGHYKQYKAEQNLLYDIIKEESKLAKERQKLRQDLEDDILPTYAEVTSNDSPSNNLTSNDNTSDGEDDYNVVASYEQKKLN